METDELKIARALEDVYRTNIATAADILNQWCRELSIEECRCPWGEASLRTTIGQAWDKVSRDIAALRAENDELRRRLAGKFWEGK